jgi:hypothetical protein
VVEDGPKEAKYRHFCHTDKETLRIELPADYRPGSKNLQSGQKLKMRGNRQIENGQPVLYLDSTDVQYLTVPAGNPSFSTIVNKSLVMNVSYSNQPSPITSAAIKTYFANMMVPVLLEMSSGLAGTQGINNPQDPADIVDVTIPLASGGCDINTITNQAFQAAQAKGYGNGANQYHRLFYQIPASPCGFSGVATLGWYGGYIVINGQQDFPLGCRVWCHEGWGHSLGGQYHSHSNTLNSQSCCTEEYGDFTDYMGSTDGVLHPWQRQVAGWFNVPKTPTSIKVTQSGDYTINALTNSTINAKALEIVTSDPNTSIYVSYYAQEGHYGQTGKPAGVYIHSGGTSGGCSYLLASSNNPDVVWPLAVGKTFSYPYSPIYITNKSVSATQAVIHVDFIPPAPPTSTPKFSVTVTK